ncbi:MAG TPA: plastocyanin/azurin family copper-binding protein [Verrucomicrobiae bacterium]|nr:plastocyanin/azurin family copper-binding protein [Gemmatimonadales bacterium]HXJ67875.1 plastocyanin/azurin family copper-binding protein [Verrucomicrobiae bacterium]
MTKQLRFRASRAQRALVPLFAALVVAIAVASCQGPTSPYGGGSSGGGGTGGGSTGTRFDLGPFALGQSATLAFPNAAIAGYHCIPHRAMGMTGTVLVDANGADSALVQIGAGGFSFTPSTAHIKPGGHVRWVNVSNLAIHTVTSD